MREVYLDNSATTEVSPEALAAYVETSKNNWGNPSSRHNRGKEAEDLMEDARDAVRHALGAKDGQVIFTSGGTEANNLAILGRVEAKPRFMRGGVILTTAGEHSSVARPLEALKAKGLTVVEIPTQNGVLDLDALTAALTPAVCLVTMMAVNNETGARYPLREVSRLMHKHAPDAVLHIDATQAFLKVPLTVTQTGADLVTLSSHKIRGPKGVGALWVSAAVTKNRGIAPLLLGGGQEYGLRSGTENVPGVAAFATAVRLGEQALPETERHLSALREALIAGVRDNPALSEVKLNLPPTAAPHILSLTLPKIKSETMVHFLSSRGVYVSGGSACSSHDSHLSSAMLAFGLTPEETDCTIRVSFGVQNTHEDIDRFLAALAEGLSTLVRKR